MIEIFTSNFARCHKAEGAVSIARRPPFWFRGLSYLPLAPTVEMLQMTAADYDYKYQKILDALDLEQVLDDLTRLVHPSGQIILLCFEAANKFRCHRRSLAEHLEWQLNITVCEFGFERDITPDYCSMPLKPAKPTPKLPLFNDETAKLK